MPAIYGTSGDDHLYGDVFADDQMYGGNGNDWLEGRSGSDILWGENGRDQLEGGDGNDFIFGDGSNPSEGEDDYLNGGAGDDELHGGGGLDALWGGDGTDWLLGDDGDDMLNGQAGADHLFGGVGNDRQFGDAGNDELNGGDGDDYLYGGTGSDTFIGGAGWDIAAFHDNLAGAVVNLATGQATDEVQLRGVSADYVITAESGGWRIVDAVAGRDGSTWVTSIERLRYSDNATQTLTYPAAFVGGGVKDAGAALVIPALDGGHDGGWAWSDGFDGAFRPADVSVFHPHDPWG